MKNRLASILVGCGAIVTLIVVSAHASTAGGQASTGKASPIVIPRPLKTIINFAPPSGAKLVQTEQLADQIALRDTAEFGKTTLSATTATTMGALTTAKAIPGRSALPLGTTSNQSVWVVVFKGSYVPEFANGKSFAWGALVIDRLTGGIVGSFAGNGPVPALINGAAAGSAAHPAK